MKRVFLIVAGIIVFLGQVAFAASEPEVIWAGGALRIADESDPAYIGDSLISLGQVGSTYFYSNPLAFIKNSELGIDLGAGARMPVLGGQVIAGYNIYLDYTTDNHHERISTGAEIFHPYFSTHLNLYLPFSGVHSGQEAMPGVDLTFGIPLYNAPFITLWPGGYFYKGSDRSNMQGLSFAVEVRPVKAISIFVGGRNDAIESGRNDRGEIFAKVQFTIPMQRLGDDLFKFDFGEYPANVNTMLDHRVVREPFITYERSR